MPYLRAIARVAGKWILLGTLLLGTGAAIMYYVQDYVERGVALDSVETTQEQGRRFQEQVEELTEQARQDEVQINESTEKVEGRGEVADPELVRHVKRLLGREG